MEAKEATVDDNLRPLEVHYYDLVLLSSSCSSSSSSSSLTSSCCGNENEKENENERRSSSRRRLESILASIMEALGPSGPGLLSIVGVPKAPPLRKALLPLARKLALLPKHHRAPILKDHGLGSDVPLKNLNRTVSSFALQLKFPEDHESILNGSKHELENNARAVKKELESNLSHEFQDYEFERLGYTFRELGFCMMELGLRLARICDKAIGGKELQHSILESCSAKGRLIHYHSSLDNHLLKELSKRKKGSKMAASLFCHRLPCASAGIGDEVLLNPTSRSQATEKSPGQLNIRPKTTTFKHSRTSVSDLWQQWHYDYGIFTILTTPMFLSSYKEVTTDMKNCSVSDRECSSPDGHTYLQLFDASKNKIVVVKSEPESFIVQIGESADILSRGMLRSTLHSVGRPDGLENISRETFVVFMQPAWSKVLYTSEHSVTTDIVGKESSTHSVGENVAYDKKNDSNFEASMSDDSHSLMQDILKIVPPLTSRLKDGMTFAEFSRETTRQYYGGSGIQSRR